MVTTCDDEKFLTKASNKIWKALADKTLECINFIRRYTIRDNPAPVVKLAESHFYDTPTTANRLKQNNGIVTFANI